MNCNIPVLVLLLLVAAVPAAADLTGNSTGQPDSVAVVQTTPSVRLFIPTAKMIHSDQITDMVSLPGGDTVIGTSFGLSTYNGTWSTRHQNLQNISEGLMDDYITALELGPDGSLWIGYSGGIQIYDGRSYRSIRDQQLLKETRIKDLQRWNDDMWVATGHAGIHRVHGGNWTWYQPETLSGSPFYEVRSMALDANHNVLVIATEAEGLSTVLPADGDRYTFRQIAPKDGTWGRLLQVHQDPRGGVFLSNESAVVAWDPEQGIVPVLSTGDLAPGVTAINDLAPASDGRLYIATDSGIFVWEDGKVTGHLSRFEGIGTSPVVRTVAIDAQNRVWFSTPGYVGFIENAVPAAPTIGIRMMITPVPETTPAPAPVFTATPAPALTPAVTPREPSFFPDDSAFRFLNPLIDPLLTAIRSIGSRTP